MKRLTAAAVVHLVAASLAATLAPAAAETAWPTKPLRIIIPFAAGGGTDIAARHLQPHLAEAIGQPVVIENKSGGGGIIGTEQVARAAPDGHTIGMMVSSHASNPALYATIPYDAVKDLKAVTILFRATNVWAVHPSSPHKTLGDVLAAAKAAPGKVVVVSSGNGTAQHLGFEQLKLTTGTDMVHVPYRGAGPALNDLVNGQVPIGILNISSTLPHIQAGRLRAIAVTSGQRSVYAPDIATVAETVPGFDSVEWFAFNAPAGVPDEIIEKIYAAIVQAAGKPEFAVRAKEMGVDLVLNKPADFQAMMISEVAKFAELVKKANIKLD